jgi:hypothetical protein
MGHDAVGDYLHVVDAYTTIGCPPYKAADRLAAVGLGGRWALS